ncbi:MAG TPA: prolyl oligopeptidase family serine peptidase [Thermoanaerobaculia bacterium]|nr:prolyl oligopeptidase family serine peptidase [Thermoanaerobaculia bacterium]
MWVKARAGLLGILFAAAAAGAAPSPPPSSPSFTLAQVLSYPFPLAIRASRTGARVAWIENRKGARNVWVAEGPAWKARRLTGAEADDGQELTQLQFSKDGRRLVWVRGGDHDANWPSPVEPNPALGTGKPALEIWGADFEKGKPGKLAEGDGPAISPDGERVAFLKDHQAWWVPFDGKKDAASLFFCRGDVGSLAWSPDGKLLAFVSDRGDHSLIGIFSSEKEPIRFLDPSISRDSNPVWSPDGSRVAFIREPGSGGPPERLFEEDPHPWSIWTADAATGNAHVVWSSPETLEGSVPETDAGPSLDWAARDRLVFLSEVDGWPHLYSVPESGGAPVLLTPGNFMVDAIALTPDRRQVVYVANTGADAGDDDRRHLFRVPVDAATPVPLTSGAGLEWMPAVAGDGSSVVFVAAGAKAPPQTAVMPLAGGAPRMLAPREVPADFPADRLVVPRKVVFEAPDGLTIHGQIFEAAGGSPKKPALLFLHGGPPRQMLLGWHYMDYYAYAYGMNQYLASRGYVAMTVNYRLGVGYGRAFQHPEHAGPAGASEYQDVLAAGRYLASLPEVDRRRVGVWGGSYGGYLTAMALARSSDLFAAGVDWHGVHDWLTEGGDSEIAAYVRRRQLRYEKGDLKEAMDVAWKSSPDSMIDGWKSPVLLIQGDDDRNVDFHQTVDLARRLDRAKVPHEVIVIPDEIHGFLRWASWVRAETATADFFDRRFATEK